MDGAMRMIEGVDPEFARLMVVMAEAYPSFRLREGTVRVYYQALRDLSNETLEAAMARAIKESEFYPTIAFIRRMVGPTTDDAGILAWTALMRAAQVVGAYQSLVLEDPAAAAAMVAVFGSWPGFCVYEQGPELAQKRQEFLAAYRDARRQAMQGLTRLAGLCEASGRYQHAGACWAGLVTAHGDVRTAREPELLPAAPSGLIGDGR